MDNAAIPGAGKTAPCWGCGNNIDAADAYCRFCGRGQGSRVPWQYKHWGVIVITLLGLGPFSLFYLWRSPVISRGAKLAYSAAILLATWYVVDRLYALWTFTQQMLGGAQLY
jgi:hypothetical protein